MAWQLRGKVKLSSDFETVSPFPCGKRLLFCEYRPEEAAFQVLNTETGEVEKKFGDRKSVWKPHVLRWMEKGKGQEGDVDEFLVVSKDPLRFSVWSAKSGALVRDLPAPKEITAVSDAVFLPDGESLLIAGYHKEDKTSGRGSLLKVDSQGKVTRFFPSEIIQPNGICVKPCLPDKFTPPGVTLYLVHVLYNGLGLMSFVTEEDFTNFTPYGFAEIEDPYGALVGVAADDKQRHVVVGGMPPSSVSLQDGSVTRFPEAQVGRVGAKGLALLGDKLWMVCSSAEGTSEELLLEFCDSSA
uniref:Uncharacterized protein n=1 Tax=Chromera velia CCMP2878 TaxID=1169474 RepID=A0A0G4HRK3_9ALVE|eukprot:Cvel_30617.t1-p1 / transcript=Cvel_30617.t1 / gene=Cvel_30617 / organism=Chromera_velia_CCMP2878 / gene_product=hypothetical protein / transcript_product=hypothetical protein / location=Cvel_scaffold4395:5797-6687(-) / protein_length=297 / sequence_SO=supercontig / SO=protein_coding / is_pseudo=false